MRKVFVCLLGLATAALVVLLAYALVTIPLDPEAKIGDLAARLGLAPVILGAAAIVAYRFCDPRELRNT